MDTKKDVTLVAVAGGILTTLGAVDAIVGLTTSPMGWRSGLSLIVGLSLLCVAWHLWPKLTTPVQLSLADFRFDFASAEEVPQLFRIEERAFMPDDVLPLHSMQEWHRKNDEIYVVLKRDSEIVGYFALAHFDDPTMVSFCRGQMKERHIHADSLLAKGDAAKSHSAYILSIAVARRYRKDAAVGALLICRLKQRVDSLVIPKGTASKVYATAASSEGLRLLKSYRFKEIQPGNERVDGNSLFVREFQIRPANPLNATDVADDSMSSGIRILANAPSQHSELSGSEVKSA